MNTFLENSAIILNTFLEIFFIVVFLLFYYVLLGNVLLPCLAYFKKINGSVSLLMMEMVFLLLMVILSFGIKHPWNIGPLKIFLFGIISILISYVLMYAFGCFFYYLIKKKHDLGVMYENGIGVKQDYAKALNLYAKAAEQGYANSQNNLGLMYEKGQGVKQDYAVAAQWYTKAAEQGLAASQHNLGMMYASGIGVTQDDAEAMRWYTKAADQGFEDAQVALEEIAQLSKTPQKPKP